MKKLKILEICPFSSGIGGVSSRVLQESREFINLGYQVTIFSSNLEEGTGKIVKSEETIGKINVIRFPAKTGFFDRLISKNVTYFNFEEDFNKLNPDIVVTHLFHPHSFKALELSLKKNIPCYLVTHAPFNVNRKFPLNLITSFFYFLKKSKMNQFTKIISITKWENSYLNNLGITDKIIYIPNGLSKDFFTQKKSKSNPEVLFLGRISPVKNIETLLNAAKLLPEIKFNLVGQAEQGYLSKLKLKIKTEKIENVIFKPPVYNLKEKIKLIDSCNVFVLSSKREAMPQVLIEAMSRGKLVISSKTDGGKEIISSGENGFLFSIDNYNELADLIKKNINGDVVIQRAAEEEAKKYSWETLIKSYVSLFK